ncbi:MAG: DUF473 family protein [Candidatus Methanofastidiosia archaeon]
MFAITCISPHAYKELLEGGIRTFELRSTHNINSIAKANTGDLVFVTCKAEEDMTKETEGIIAMVKSFSIYNRRRRYDYDEYEITTARIQLEVVETAKIKDFEKPAIGREVSVEIEKFTYYRIS